MRQVVYAFSDTLDLVGVDDFFHGKRVGLMAMELAQTMGWDQDAQDEIFHAGLLHDCGVSSTVTHQHLVQNLEWSDAHDHCEVGYMLLDRFSPLAHLAPLVRYHHSRWSDLLTMPISRALALQANLLFLADRVDALAAPHYGPHLLEHKEDIGNTLASHRGDLFAPELLDAFLTTARADAFWLMLEPRHIQNYLSYMMHRGHHRILDFNSLKQLATLFSVVVDAKSPFTAAHSIGVAHLAKYLGTLCQLSADSCDLLEIAGLMHDLGKLQIPDHILEKPGMLDGHERQVMNRHSFETYQILRRIPGLERIACWAAYHHETLDGTGYPYSLKASQLPIEARIIAVADIFQALAQNRPYRSALPPSEISSHLQSRARQGLLDASVVSTAIQHLDECWRAAVSAEPL